MIKSIEKFIDKMPSLPATVSRVMEICDDPATSPADLNRVVGLDPVLMGKVMQLINSAYYGRPNKITSLVRAIILLGLNTVKNLALSTAVLGNLSSGHANDILNMDGFWEHSLCTGVIAKKIAAASKIDPKRHEEFFIAGLLHDIGKIPFTNCFPQEYLAAISSSDMNRKPLHQVESELFTFDHQIVGALVADHWKIEGAIKDAIEYHHRPEEYEGENRQLVYAVAIADYLSLYLERGFAGNRYPVEPSASIYDSLGVSFDQLESMSNEIKNEIEKARVFLKISQ
ncbi:MAG: HDOD domain-containing protein [Spirochaetales bacterium]|uniref:HDOD domain-containing protein n=1 Tax=Candidatus Thalassospirochaeta sargassi TaxID=3119039 RepID=A0AAJ1MJS4_9SPIO|nr:HDOD domain-containing protein [Spirochaetales bacterium]